MKFRPAQYINEYQVVPFSNIKLAPAGFVSLSSPSNTCFDLTEHHQIVFTKKKKRKEIAQHNRFRVTHPSVIDSKLEERKASNRPQIVHNTTVPNKDPMFIKKKRSSKVL